MFNFEFKNTRVIKAIRRYRNPIFSFARLLKNVFSILFVVSIFLIIFSLLNFTSGYSASKMLMLFLSLYLLFWEIDLFLESKVKNLELTQDILKASANPDDYNLAEFLDFGTAEIVLSSIAFCKRKKIQINSASLLFFALKSGKDIDIVFLRLGINPKKLQTDLKNYLEKIPKIILGTETDSFSEDFKSTIRDAVKISAERSHKNISEKEILVALAKNNEFLEKVLMDFDLKLEDVANLTLWLDSAEDVREKSKKFWSKENLSAMGSFGKNFSAGYTITLDKFSVDWTKTVSKWKFREIIGHKREISEAEVILAKSDSSNVLIVGESGTGRKSIVQAIAQKCYVGTSLPELNNKRVVELDAVLLSAQISDFEKLETAIDQIFSEAISAGNIILVIDKLEDFVGQKTQKVGSFDLSGVLSKYLPLPNFKFIGITSYDGLHKNIEQNRSFASLFEKVEVSEVTEIETINILQTDALELEYLHKVIVLYPSIREIVNLTARYMPSLPFPKKALDIMNESVVYVQKLRGPRGCPIVLPHHIAEIISKKTDIPVGKMEVKEKEVLLNLENLIHNRIINQEESVNEISIAMRRARMGIGSKTRPMGAFLFLGPTGVGKTETAKALAEIYFGSEKKMIRLDMSEFQTVSDIPRLIGGSAGESAEMQGLLTTPVRDAQFSLILLDEVEKAHPNILNLFLQVLDEGHITDGQGRKVVFTNTIIIATSNAGAGTIFKQVESGKPVEKDKLLNELFDKNIFKPEFINRFDATIVFHPLTKDNLMKIAQLFLKSLQKNLKEKDINFIITEQLKEKIVELSYKPEFGAREMRRVIQDRVENVVASALLSENITKGDKFEINPENFELITNPENSLTEK